MVDILDAGLQGLLQLFTWKAFALQLAGIAIGFMVGILPGIGGPVTLGGKPKGADGQRYELTRDGPFAVVPFWNLRRGAAAMLSSAGRPTASQARRKPGSSKKTGTVTRSGTFHWRPASAYTFSSTVPEDAGTAHVYHRFIVQVNRPLEPLIASFQVGFRELWATLAGLAGATKAIVFQLALTRPPPSENSRM